MTDPVAESQPIWTKRWTFVLAAAGSAVGLGNIWKFPYMTGENGGSAFVLVYLVCIAAVGIPIMLAEVLLGRLGRRSPIETMQQLARDYGGHRLWSLVGWSGTLAGLLILSFYSVIGGWALAFVFELAAGTHQGADGAAAAGVFEDFLASPALLVMWHSLFLGFTVWVVAQGVVAGLERTVRFLMPMLLVLMLVLLGYAMTTPGFADGFAFLFHFDASELSWNSALIAMGHAFFTLSLGMGSIMVYGAYMPSEDSIGSTVLTVAALDTAVALVAGLVIFPIVFSFSLEPGAGPGLMFITLPLAFGNIAFGQWVGIAFFVLVSFAAWTSAISLIEPAVAYVAGRFGWSRARVAVALGLLVWVLGFGSVLSFNHWAEFKLLDTFTVFDGIDFLTSAVMLPLGGLFMALFVGWVLHTERVYTEVGIPNPTWFRAWQWTLRVLAPAAVAVVFVVGIADKFA